MTIGNQMPELDWYKIGSQNSPYKLGLTSFWPYKHRFDGELGTLALSQANTDLMG